MSKTIINKRSKIIWDNGFAPDGQSLPATTSADSGKVLGVDSNGDYALKEDAGAVLPEITAQDEGKVLKVTEGNLAWENDNSASYTAGANISIDNGVISATDTTYTAGTNVSISAENVISATDTTYSDATTTDAGLMSAADKVKLNGIADNANNYSLPTADASTLGGVKVGSNLSIDANGVLSATDTTYTAGNGITITGTSIAANDQLPSVTSSDEGNVLTVDSQGNWVPDAVPKELPTVSSVDAGKILEVDSNGNWAKADNSAAMVKAAIADDYAGADGTLPFYPIFTDAIASSGNMERDCLAGQNSGWAGTAGARPYSTTRNDVYMAIYKDSGNYGIVLLTAGNLAGNGEVKIQYISQDGTIQTDETTTYITQAFTGTVNSGYVNGNTTSYCLYHANYSLISADLITCAKDLSLCVYNSRQDAIDAFGAWQIPGSYNEGDQVWKDGKLQTYTSGNWVDSDTIVEQIANAGGGGGSETWTLVGEDASGHDYIRSQTGGAYVITPSADITGYKKIVVELFPSGSGWDTNTITNFTNTNPIQIIGYPNKNGAGATNENAYIFQPWTLANVGQGSVDSQATIFSLVVQTPYNSYISGYTVNLYCYSNNSAAHANAKVKIWGVK